jgi:hypothetical protein
MSKIYQNQQSLSLYCRLSIKANGRILVRPTLIFALGAAILISSIALARQPHATSGEPNTVPPHEVKSGRAVAQKFAEVLQHTLTQALANGGPANGLTVCHEKAGQIATELTAETNMLVGRTSLKLRNPANAPDNWELAVLKQFEARHAQGEAIENLEFFAVIDDDQGQKTFRYMKGIATTTPCLACHGDPIDADLDAKLKALYPEDKARGYKEGELRGAFTLAKPLQ